METRRLARIGALALTLVALAWIAACSDDNGPGPKPDGPVTTTLKVGFIYIGPPGDLGWTFGHDAARKQVESELDNVETQYVENVKEESAAVVAEADKMVADGVKLIFAASFGFQDGTEAAAKKHADVKFEHCSGSKSGTNMNAYFGRMYEARFLAGYALAAHLKKAGKPVKLCTSGAYDIPEVFRLVNASFLGAKKVDPTATMQVMWLGSWYDPTNEKAQSEKMLAAGCEGIIQNSDTTSALLAAETAGKFAVGYHSDVAKFAKNAVVTSATWNWAIYYKHQIQAVQEGTWKGGNVPPANWYGLKDGWVKLAPISSFVDAAITTEVDKLSKDIQAGTLHPFAGPFKLDKVDSVAAGENASDKLMWSDMKGFVEGVTELCGTADPTAKKRPFSDSCPCENGC